MRGFAGYELLFCGEYGYVDVWNKVSDAGLCGGLGGIRTPSTPQVCRQRRDALLAAAAEPPDVCTGLGCEQIP